MSVHTACIYGECAHKQHVRTTLTLTLTRMITAYSVSGNVVHVRTLVYVIFCKCLYCQLTVTSHGLLD